MTEELIAELLNEYLGKKVKEEYSVWGYLDAKKLFEQKIDYVEKNDLYKLTSLSDERDEYDPDIILTMGIQIEFDENNCISDINLSFLFSQEGESGSFVADPEDYWEYSDCYDHASEFIEKVLEE